MVSCFWSFKSFHKFNRDQLHHNTPIMTDCIIKTFTGTWAIFCFVFLSCVLFVYFTSILSYNVVKALSFHADLNKKNKVPNDTIGLVSPGRGVKSNIILIHKYYKF